jgi:hypothetical protein
MSDLTTARIYASDSPKLLRLQLAVAGKEGALPTVAEVIHRLIVAEEERGNA